MTRLIPALLCSAALLLPAVARADQVLTTHNGSLTTYLPSAKSNVQDVRPLVEQRGVHVDGTLRLGSQPTMAMAGNPSREQWDASQVLSSVRLDTGTFLIDDVDLSFPAEVSWVIGRSYNTRQKSAGSYYASAGYQGKNWFQNSQPELVFYDSATNSEDVIYLFYGADRFIELGRADVEGTPSNNTFRAVNGAAGAILITTDAEGPDLATYYDGNGSRMVFFWVNDADIDDDIEGSLWKVIDPAGNVAYVGHATNASTALSSYDATTGAITTAYDSAGRKFTYTYTSGQLTQVKAEEGTTEVGRVDYSYYVAADTHGEDNDLKLVTITTPLTDSGVSLVRKKYYRYYEGTYNATTNPGYHHQIRYIVDFEGYRGYDWRQDGNLDDDPLSASEDNLKPYASASFQYDTERHIVSGWFNGACGCSGASSGTHTFEYETNGSYSDNSGYDTTWRSRTIVERPSVTYQTSAGAIESWVTQYFDEVGQPLHRVQTALDPDDTSGSQKVWATKVTRNSDGQLTDIQTTANVTAYTHSSASFTTSTSAGLVTVFTRVSSGDMKGLLEDTKHKTGTSGSAYLDGTFEHTSATKTVGDVTITRPLVSSQWVYSEQTTTEAGGGSGPSGSYQTSYSYTMYTGDAALMPKQITTTPPAVSTSKNGSGSSTTSKQYLRTDGTTAFSESPTGSFTYTRYTDGALTKRIDDARTNHATDFTPDDPNTDFGITETGDGVRRITTYAYDKQGRKDTTTQSNGQIFKSYYSQLGDERQVTLRYNDYVASPLKFYGPVRYAVVNHAGRTEVEATVALASNESTTALTGHVDETDSDPITAMDLGTVAQMTVNVYDETGGVLEVARSYYDVPGEDYDATFFGYDDAGTRVRTKEPHGTITRTDYDTLGRIVRQWIGTNDSGFDGGESSGTDTMVKTLQNEYDSGNDKGNSYLTERTLYVQDSSTDERVTSFSHDVRGRTLLQTTPETPPHIFNKFDNVGRLVASGQYSSPTNIDISTDDPTTETSNRLALSQAFYDEMGRAWKTQRHKIDDADGSDDDNLQTLNWYDAAGRAIKVDGPQLTKSSFDRLGRQTHRFILSDDNDTAYGNADDVSGDHVLEELQTTFESTDSDDVVMSALIARRHNDVSGIGTETTGALDTNADADSLKYTATNVKGRIQITVTWYDRFGRQTDVVRYGTYGDSDFDRDGLSVPARSDTALLTEYDYNTDGTLKDITDPKALVTRHEYDDLGRQTTVITNYVDGTPSGDTDQTVKYEYTNGLRTKLTADLPSGEDDQETIYRYGTTKGTGAGDSTIATGHLLDEVQYPDSTGGTDLVSFAYNAQSQQVWTKDQEGNVVETDYDDAGREIHRRITTLITGFNGAVRRISTAYDDLARRRLVTQYDNATVGSGSVVDEVKHTYDDWGPLSTFEQDHNSAVGASGSVDDYEISYTYAKDTGGRNTIRRSKLTLPDATEVTYTYKGLQGQLDDDASRVTEVKVGTTIVASYSYNGAGHVVGTEYPEPDVMWRQYGSTSGSYPDLDRFNRVTSSRWTKDLATDKDFYDLDVTYDRNSNIPLAEDNVHASVDASYTIDNLNRLTQAREGTWNSGTSQIDNTKRNQIWTTLSQTGNWELVKLDLNGDDDYSGTGEYKDNRTHNKVNELTGQDLDDNAATTGNNYTPTSDKVGNLTDDKQHFTYEYDPFGRLRKVNTTVSPRLLAEYRYNGLGYRIAWHYDVDADGTVESTSDDPWYYFAYDDRWRIVATFRSSDTSPKERFVYHNAGDNGTGGSSYIDAVILRDKDANTAWSSASDGTLEDRIYSCQNWRSDVVALIADTDDQVEQVRYSPYGIPFGLLAGDADSDGDVDSSDLTQIQTWIDAPQYDIRGDLDLDGDVDSTDKTTATNNSGRTLGWGLLSGVGNRKGYAGYELDDALASSYRLYHVRNRVLNADLGRWIRRDSLQYVDGVNLYACTASNPLATTDPTGLIGCSSTLASVGVVSMGPLENVDCKGEIPTICESVGNQAAVLYGIGLFSNEIGCDSGFCNIIGTFSDGPFSHGPIDVEFVCFDCLYEVVVTLEVQTFTRHGLCQGPGALPRFPFGPPVGIPPDVDN